MAVYSTRPTVARGRSRVFFNNADIHEEGEITKLVKNYRCYVPSESSTEGRKLFQYSSEADLYPSFIEFPAHPLHPFLATGLRVEDISAALLFASE